MTADDVEPNRGDGCVPDVDFAIDPARPPTQEGGRLLEALGARLAKLGVPGEAEYEGRGVSHCADCDAPMFSGQSVVVAGGGGGGFSAPSHCLSAVAGVQKLSRQQSSFVPFFQTVPSVARQLSFVALDCATDASGAASAADAKSTATLFSFFIDSPLEESRRRACVSPNRQAGASVVLPGKNLCVHARTGPCHRQKSLCHRVSDAPYSGPRVASPRPRCCAAATWLGARRILRTRRPRAAAPPPSRGPSRARHQLPA